MFHVSVCCAPESCPPPVGAPSRARRAAIAALRAEGKGGSQWTPLSPRVVRSLVAWWCISWSPWCLFASLSRYPWGGYGASSGSPPEPPFPSRWASRSLRRHVSPEPPRRSSIPRRLVLPLLLAVALRRHFPSGVLRCSPRGPGPVLGPPGVSALVQLGRCVGSRPDPSSGAGPVFGTKCCRVAGLAAVGRGCDVFGLRTLCI